jgi:hypothetical protein
MLKTKMVKESVEKRGIKLGTYMSSGASAKKGSSEYNTREDIE